MTDYPTDCACGSRCDGHAVAAPEDPGLEWGGIVPRGGHALMGGPGPTLHDPISGQVYHIVDAVSTEGEVIYSDRSPREEWVSAWEVSRAAHR